MRIGINARYLAKSDCGNVTYLLNLIRGLAKYDTQNQYVIFVMNQKDGGAVNIKQDNFRFVEINPMKHNLKSNLNWDLGIADTEEFQKESLDILHCTHFAIPKAFYKSSNKPNVKIVTNIHDIIPSNVFRLKSFIDMGMPFKTMSSEGLIMRFLEPKMIKRVDEVITFSDYVKREVVRYLDYAADNITVIPHFPAQYFEKINHKARLDEIKAKYNLPDRFIAYFSGYHKRKNVSQLVKVFKRIARRYKDVYLVFIGEGSQPTKLKKQNINNTVFTGKISKEALVYIINLSEFTISTSLSEGFGLCTIESMKCGKICLCSENSPMEEISGGSTLYFNPRDGEDIYNVVTKIIDNPTLRIELERKASKRIKLFTEKRHIKDTINVYERAYQRKELH